MKAFLFKLESGNAIPHGNLSLFHGSTSLTNGAWRMKLKTEDRLPSKRLCGGLVETKAFGFVLSHVIGLVSEVRGDK